MATRTVTLDPDGTNELYVGVIVEYPTGVLYVQQCAGTECLQNTVEGYYVPLGGLMSDPDQGRVAWPILQAPFHSRGGCSHGWRGSLTTASVQGQERLAQLRAAVETIPYFVEEQGQRQATRECLRLDESRIEETCEAWVPVLTPEGRGILTWPNCD